MAGIGRRYLVSGRGALAYAPSMNPRALALLTLLGCPPVTPTVEPTEEPTDTPIPTGVPTPDPDVYPVVETPDVPDDPDDPAIWVHPTDASQSLVLGTDKGRPGGVYVYDLQGNPKSELHQVGLDKPNNVDIEYGFPLGEELVDIAVVTEVKADQLRVYRLPEMTPIDGGGLPVFAGEEGGFAEPSGVGIYKRPSDGAFFLHVSRDEGPTDGYLWTYQLLDDGDGTASLSFVRSFGVWSGEKDIETVIVDDELGYVYYSDEFRAVYKYHADPDHPDASTYLARFALEDEDYGEAREGMALYRRPDGTGYLIVSDQADDEMHVYRREGEPGDPHAHPRIATFRTTSVETDGMEASPVDFGGEFTGGLFVSHTDEGHFQFYRWADIQALLP